jgi:hypothetical protein
MMKEAPKGPVEKPDPTAFERMKEFTRRLISVPKEEIKREGEKREAH